MEPFRPDVERLSSSYACILLVHLEVPFVRRLETSSYRHYRAKPTCVLLTKKISFKQSEMAMLLNSENSARWEGCVNINYYDKEGQTALHLSCINGNLELVKLLVKFGADIRLANRDGWSALHIAAYGGHQDIAVYLIANSTRR
ncbi:notch-regulated ankyrin repeat-containing protein [Caerostris extrusa]|uniref:Notch-regulated ankyrin repeat-containing protein n=1 Tax=Caerostris extrusa TaxID=172846 RepID=A0AAV4QP96_CAEEX|nr:notch-regulated ankyrin repeat-containing protein [Caerostris extrusa]